MKKSVISILLAVILVVSMLPVSAFAASDENHVELSVTIRDFKADHKLFENEMGFLEDAPGLVKDTLGSDKKPVYNLSLWKEIYGSSVTQKDLDALFNDVSGVNMKTTKTLTLRPDEDGYWAIDSSLNEKGEETDGYFPIDNELFGNEFVDEEGEIVDPGHNFHFSVEIHSKFKYVDAATFEFSGDDDVWVYFNGKKVIDLGGVHGEEYGYVDLDKIASTLGIKVGDIVDFDMFYMERHTTGSNMKIKTNFDFLNLQASSWAQAGMQQAINDGLFPDCLAGTDLTKTINRQEFAAIAVKLYEAMSGEKLVADPNVSFTDCKDPDVLKAATKVGEKSVVSGYTDGSFKPTVLLNRETAATMLGNVYLMINGYASILDVKYDAPAKFTDDKELSAWASPYVYFMNANGVISGYDNKNGTFSFRPKNITSQGDAYGMCTREQALIIAEQMYQKLK